MLAAAIVVRKLTASRWIALAYLVGLTLMPAILDLVGKYHEFGSLLSALGIWEGANWLSDCIPLSILFLLSFFGELEFGVNNREIAEDSTGVHSSEPLSANTILVHRESHP